MLSLPCFSYHCRMCLRSAALKSTFDWDPLPCCCFLLLSQTGIPWQGNHVPVALLGEFPFSALYSVWRSLVKLVFPSRHPHQHHALWVLMAQSSWADSLLGPGRMGNTVITCYTKITVQITITIFRSLSCKKAARALTTLGVHMSEGIVVWVCRVIQESMRLSKEGNKQDKNLANAKYCPQPSNPRNLFAACQLDSDFPVK